MLKTHDNKILINSDGSLLKTFELPKIELELRHPNFPTYLGNITGNGFFRFTTSINNRIYIDFGDGSEIYERDFSSTLAFSATDPIHTYTDGITNHTIKIWFKFPTKVTTVYWRYVDFYGKFPEGLMVYSLEDLTIEYTRISDFSTIKSPIYINKLILGGSQLSPERSIPTWLTRSRVKQLYLGSLFDLSNLDTSGVGDIPQIKDLWSVTFASSRNTNITPNFSQCPTLRYLALGGSTPVTSITPEINACKQITHLSFGYLPSSIFGTTLSNGKLEDWGVGLVGMINLEALYIGDCPSVPTEIIPGFEEALKLKTIYIRSSYNTTSRMDEFLTNLYNSVITIASMVNANTIMRQVKLEVCQTSYNSSTVRPSGTYQAPLGYIQGSNNGTPSSPMEMLYVMVKQYRWTVLVQGIDNNGIETLAP